MQIVLIGAGSAQFGLGTLGDIFSSPLLEGSRITLVDINERALAAVQKSSDAYIKEHGLPFTVQSSTDRRRALRGADVEIGRAACRERV